MTTIARIAAAILLTLPLAVAAQPRNGHGLIRGSYYEADGTAYLRPCGSVKSMRVTDETAAHELHALLGELGATGPSGLYVEVRGEERRGVLTVGELERAERDGTACKEVLRNSLFKAYGNAPLWNLYIDGTGLRFRTLAEAVPEQFPYHPYRRDGENWTFDSANGGGKLHVRLTRARCRDDKSGAVTNYLAEVDYADKHYRGCAYGGSLLPGIAGR